MPDGATMTFDVFEPLAEHSSGGDYTMCVCPGIANSSESVYIRTFVDHAQRNGYRVAVLNHLGALKNIKLTAPRIFSYGETDEYARMIEEIERVFPNSKLLSIGFSMGGNLICKYLGDSIEHQRKFICAMSICQGYDAMAAMPHFTGWDLLLRFYNWAMTQNLKKLLNAHRDVLFGAHAKSLYPTACDTEKIFWATALSEIDEVYTRRRAGFSSLEEFYTKSSCRYVLNNIDMPIFFLNAEDDPLIHKDLWHYAKEYVMTHEKAVLAVTKHGGHLGFFECEPSHPYAMHPLTWLDKVIVQYGDAVINSSKGE
ncbi:unnamed protein product [Owenia fusiformis]|nr:unnamed protein product [Owenia fusiformis]